MEIFFTVLIAIALYTSYEIIIYNKIQKENERNNKKRFKKINSKREKPISNAKVSKTKTQNNNKHRSTKKKIKK